MLNFRVLKQNSFAAIFSFLLIVFSLTCSFTYSNKMLEKKSSLIVLRGSLAVGKTTLSNLLEKELLEKGYKVVILHWDDIFFLINPHEHMNTDLALNVTRSIFDLAYSIQKNRAFDFMIIEGTFVLPEELKMIDELAKMFNEYYLFKLQCNQKTQLYRNMTRISEDFIEEERILIVNEIPFWDLTLPCEVIIDTGLKSKNLIVDQMLSDIGSK